jgi:RNA-directed DNA polymerase
MEPLKGEKQMNADKTACASADKPESWEDIDFKACDKAVKRLQMRIAKAQMEGKHGKVKSLQWLLTHSFTAKALAVKRVTENRGKKTSGVDHEVWATPKAKFNAISTLRRHGYNTQPLLRKYIAKKNSKKKRPLGIPVMRDKAMQTLYRMALEPIAETTADHNSYGFRVKRSTHDAIGECFCQLAKAVSAEWILEGDIKGCFDNISHDWLLENIPMDKTILRKWLKCGVFEDGEWFPTENGTPQGGAISPILANMTLDGLETKVLSAVKRKYKGTKVIKPKIHFVRYADDFIITGATREILEDSIMPALVDFMSKRGLTLSLEKTHIAHISDGFDFLGQNVRKYNGKLLIKPAKKNVKSFLDKVRNIIRNNYALSQENLIRALNPVIRGWYNYHKHVVSKRTFHSVDYHIFKSLWHWAVRRHPEKGKGWVKERYFRTVGNRTWTFACPTDLIMDNGEPYLLTLEYASETRIRRHTKIKGAANPFSEEWQQYFEEREGVKMLSGVKGRKTLLGIWKRQKGLCPACGEPINAETTWKFHKEDDGKVTVRQILHTRCHNHLHHQSGF